ncbi:hypothetical protein AAEX63_15840 [Luteococcus sp. H138]|uniref:hypothetical protein n=1 Tax=unclassified Luteococcus TaxID=2639923 RepID=UPI00313F32E9
MKRPTVTVLLAMLFVATAFLGVVGVGGAGFPWLGWAVSLAAILVCVAGMHWLWPRSRGAALGLIWLACTLQFVLLLSWDWEFPLLLWFYGGLFSGIFLLFLMALLYLGPGRVKPLN